MNLENQENLAEQIEEKIKYFNKTGNILKNKFSKLRNDQNPDLNIIKKQLVKKNI